MSDPKRQRGVSRRIISRRQGRSVKLALLVVWMGLVVIQTSQHVFWRDEVRALSVALQGSLPFGFLTTLRGEGHPAVWYFLLRGAFVGLGRPQALPAVAFLVAFGAMLILVLRAPFRWPLIAVILFSHFALFEYSVMARNYGISALALFGFAALYHRHRHKGFVLGAVLFLLANCNVLSVVLVGGVLIAWGGDVIIKGGLRWSRSLRVFLQNAALALVGVLVCLATVYPTLNDAGARDWARMSPVLASVRALIDPASQMSAISSGILLSVVHLPGHWSQVLKVIIEALMSGLLFASVLGLLYYPAALAAALASLLGLSLFFALGVEGAYRHEALWLVLLTVLYWITDVASPPPEKWRPAGVAAVRALMRRGGRVAFIVLMALQLLPGLADIMAIRHPAPLSRSKEFARLVASRPDLRDAVVISEPDYLLESIPFYLSNPLYLMSQHQYGDIVSFNKHGMMQISLAEILQTARQLRAQSHHPVLILMQRRLETIAPGETLKEGYNWTVTTTPETIAEFEASTDRLARFDPVPTSENFDVYQLR